MVSARGLSLLPVLMLVLTSCSTQYSSGVVQESNAGRYSISQDRGPDQTQTLSADDIVIPTPRFEPISPRGNASPYVVNGRQYYVLASADQYVEEGLASWYGAKFHGHTTSNGEVFDMYQISAAHRSLPLPTWVRVTNLENNKSIIARVNDRGPFHPGRVIDLSYAGAVKLDYVHKGTARVRVEALSFDGGGSSSPAPVGQTAYYVQLGAFSERNSAEALRDRVSGRVQDTVRIDHSDLFRVRIGPVDYDRALQLQQQLTSPELGRPMLVGAN
ncbi:septal ring lytic transglycosylase RlpA family protein [Saccharospirillum mangrovi]|uniref:septal ring lytic transglycosylase RlpA family protein n=1 Tax=Saccharospirillum mangrovi TaxID=2161747 RepID=UPI000D334853|nr:septal ring lytic transglycosylase RlpA family protein [Saccharospirillum mangrovi]